MLISVLAVVGSGAILAGAAPDPGSGVRVTENLYDSKILPDGHAWRVGAFGLISRSRDGGKTWQSLPSKTTEQLFGVDFANDRVGWAVGRAGILLHTEDGGDTWTAQNSGTTNHLFGVEALSATNVWALGDWGAILHTTDGGKTWQNRSLAEDVILNGMSWVDDQHGWIVGEVGAVYRTTDGGETWTKIDSGSEKSLFGVHFIDDKRGWAVGLDGVMIRTQDGGDTWEVQRGNPQIGSLEAMGFLEALKNAGLYAISVEGNLGVAVGDLGMILVSRDGGATWKEETGLPEEWSLRWIRGVSLAKGNGGMLVGSNGLTIPVVDGVLQYPGR